jgi:hypothetical protein
VSGLFDSLHVQWHDKYFTVMLTSNEYTLLMVYCIFAGLGFQQVYAYFIAFMGTQQVHAQYFAFTSQCVKFVVAC